MVHILGLCASPRREGATAYALRMALEGAQGVSEEIETSMVTLAGKRIAPCTDCKACIRSHSWCVIPDDMRTLVEQLDQADGILVASPVYCMGPTPQLSAFCSRLRAIRDCFPGLLRGKFLAALAVGGTRNGGQETTVAAIHNLFGIRGMNLVTNEPREYMGGRVWYDDAGAEGAQRDTLGMAGAVSLGRRLAETTLIYSYGKQVWAQRQETTNP